VYKLLILNSIFLAARLFYFSALTVGFDCLRLRYDDLSLFLSPNSLPSTFYSASNLGSVFFSAVLPIYILSYMVWIFREKVEVVVGQGIESCSM